MHLNTLSKSGSEVLVWVLSALSLDNKACLCVTHRERRRHGDVSRGHFPTKSGSTGRYLLTGVRSLPETRYAEQAVPAATLRLCNLRNPPSREALCNPRGTSSNMNHVNVFIHFCLIYIWNLMEIGEVHKNIEHFNF